VVSDHADGHRRCEVFTFTLLARRWCVDLAYELTEANPDGVARCGEAEITGLRGWLGLIHIDTKHAATVDLSKPLLVVPLRDGAGEDAGPLVIDGWHRVHRALSEGRSHLPALVVTPEIEQAARIPIWR
jgi:hypothetical protein